MVMNSLEYAIAHCWGILNFNQPQLFQKREKRAKRNLFNSQVFVNLLLNQSCIYPTQKKEERTKEGRNKLKNIIWINNIVIWEDNYTLILLSSTTVGCVVFSWRNRVLPCSKFSERANGLLLIE